VIKEARQAFSLKDFSKSISLYFSIPAGVPCYDSAMKESIRVYRTFQNDRCKKQLIILKGLVGTTSPDEEGTNMKYTEALKLIAQMDPNTDCYREAIVQIEKIEKRLTEEQKREWEMEQKRMQIETELKKEYYKAMGKISSQYKPPVNYVFR